MRLIIRAALLLLGMLICGGAQAQSSAVGNWLTEDRSGVIAIAPCGASLCGRIVGMDAPRRADGSPDRDPAGHAFCGLSILRADPSSPGVWDGHIINPNDDSSWTCRLTLADDGTLHLRGYVLLPMLGRTQIWTRYPGTPGAGCAMS